MANPFQLKPLQPSHLSYLREQLSHSGHPYIDPNSKPANTLKKPYATHYIQTDASTSLSIGHASSSQSFYSKVNSSFVERILSPVATFALTLVLGRSMQNCEQIGKIKSAIKQLPCHITPSQRANFERILKNMDAIESNRYWAAINRITVIVGILFSAIGYLFSLPLTLGGTLMTVAICSAAVRLGYYGLEGSQEKAIEIALSNLDESLKTIPSSQANQIYYYLPTLWNKSIAS